MSFLRKFAESLVDKVTDDFTVSRDTYHRAKSMSDDEILKRYKTASSAEQTGYASAYKQRHKNQGDKR